MLKIIRLVKLQHALFALPLTIASIILASKEVGFNLLTSLSVIVAFLSARSIGMALNRLFDRKIDALNPRTAHRLMASKQLSVKEVWLWVIGFMLVFLLACLNLNPLALKLMPICIFLLAIYPLAKRVTSLAHAILGLILALGPIGAWVGIAGMPNIAILFFGLGVSFWVFGFDILYALQDLDFDQKTNLYSIPAKFGAKKAKAISACAHFLVPIIWFIAGFYFHLGLIYNLGLLFVFSLLVYEHILIHKGLEKNIGLAFFKLNVFISSLVFILILIEALI